MGDLISRAASRTAFAVDDEVTFYGDGISGLADIKAPTKNGILTTACVIEFPTQCQ
jgi:hypothetical protein